MTRIIQGNIAGVVRVVTFSLLVCFVVQLMVVVLPKDKNTIKSNPYGVFSDLEYQHSRELRIHLMSRCNFNINIDLRIGHDNIRGIVQKKSISGCLEDCTS